MYLYFIKNKFVLMFLVCFLETKYEKETLIEVDFKKGKT